MRCNLVLWQKGDKLSLIHCSAATNEEYLSLVKSRALCMDFVDLEKAFDSVPREIVWWTLREQGVDEWLASVIKV